MFQDAMFLGMVPSLFMLTSTYIGLGKEVPDDISGALQHFAAGVLLCTVGTELLPEIVNAKGWAENISAFIGFFCGVGVLIILGMFSPAEQFVDQTSEDLAVNQHDNILTPDDFSGNNDAGGEYDNTSRCGNKSSPKPGQQQQNSEMRFFIAGRKFRQRPTFQNNSGKLRMHRSMSLSSLPMVSEREPLVTPASVTNTNKSSSNSYTENSGTGETTTTNESNEQTLTNSETPKQFPLAFVIAVAIDSSLDGLLIGIASAAGPSAGPMMSASLSVEMGFLGLTLATTLQGQSLQKSSLAALVGPICLVLAAGLGGVLANTLSESPVAFIGMLSFGASALLFMVAEELLLDAHESGDHVWWVDLQLYTGFFASIMAGKLAR